MEKYLKIQNKNDNDWENILKDHNGYHIHGKEHIDILYIYERSAHTFFSVRSIFVKYVKTHHTVNGNGDRTGNDHALGRAPPDLEAEGVDDGVVPVHTDGEQEVNNQAGQGVLHEADYSTYDVREDPTSGKSLTDYEWHHKNWEQDVGDRERGYKVVGGGLDAPAPANDETDQHVTHNVHDGQQKEHNEFYFDKYWSHFCSVVGFFYFVALII